MKSDFLLARGGRAVRLAWVVAVATAGGSPGEVRVVLDYVAAVKTVSGNPFGLGLPLLTEVRGSFSYLAGATDTNASAQRGDYPHSQGTTFEAHLPGLTLTGSGQALLQTEDFSSDTFRFVDGNESQNRAATMSRDGVPDATLKLWLAITDASGSALAGDALPVPFPAPLLATVGKVPPDPPHTFQLQDASGTALLQFVALRPRANPAPRILHLSPGPDGKIGCLWSSEPGLGYRVESSLDGQGWQVLVANRPSQGTTTAWLDDLAARLPAPLPARIFYRVGPATTP